MKPAGDLSIERAARAIAQAKCMLITAGAGMGVDSGLPDFRGPEGFWRAYPPMKKLNLKLEDMSTPSWFSDDPKFAWGFFGHRLNLYRKTTPHDGYGILRGIAEKMKNDYFVFTSNVDGHFEKSGFNSNNILECHGSINFLQCTSCDPGIWPSQSVDISVDSETFRASSELPKCKSCSAVARPNILMFGDYGWDCARCDEQNARISNFMQTLENEQFVVIEIGAGDYVPTVRNFSEKVVSRSMENGTLIRINPRDYNRERE
eukprot:862877_1